MRFIAVGAVLMVALISLIVCIVPAMHDAAAAPVLTPEQVRQLSSLATTRIEVTAVESRRLEGVTGSLQAVIAVRGEVLLGVDLSEARLQEVDPHARTAVLVLPQPQVLAVTLNHHHTVVHHLTASGAWLLLPPSAGRGELLAMALDQAQQQMTKQATTPARVALAREHAQQVISHFVQTHCGWRMTLRWK